MKTKSQNLLAFIAMILVICLLGVVAVIGFGDYEGVFGDDGVTLGLDLVGGTRLVYSANVADGVDVTDEQVSTVVSMLRARLDFYGYTEATVTTDDSGRFVVEIPKISSGEAEKLLGATAKLTFETKDNNAYTVEMEGSAIESASAEYGNTGNGYDQWFVALKIKPEYKETFRAATAKASKLVDKAIYIRLDGETYSNPQVSGELDTDEVMISGSFTQESATALAGVITSGQLPFALKVEQSAQVDATLGSTALRTSLIAGGIGILLVMLIMIVVYRLPGLVASIALTGYTITIGLLISLLHVNLSLAGIAGIILSIGMAVDANVIIFERIKEELRAGRSTIAALQSGFKKAFIAIFDSNVTTVIAVIILYLLGTGPIQGFAITLGLGVILSMIFAILVTKFLLRRLVGMRVTNPKMWGLSSKKSEEGLLSRFSFVKCRKVFAIVVAVMVLVGTGSFILRGFNPDVDFSGGTTMQIDFAEVLATKGDASISDEVLDKLVASFEEAGNVAVSSAQRADNTQVVFKTTELSMDERNVIFDALAEEYGLTEKALISSSNVGATVSAEIRRNAVLASVLAIAIMLGYIWFRFDLFSGLAAVLCLAHDLFIMVAAYSLFQIPLNTTMIAALLTILGYSINATIIIFDRIRENRKVLSKTDFDAVVDVSIRQTFTRSLFTTLTTFVTVTVLFILGVSSVRQFALPLMVGIIAGFFSSVCLASNLWGLLNRLGHKKTKTEEQN